MTETKRVKPCLRYPGGKSRMLKNILPLIPEHVCYCEPFAGGLAVLLAKQRSKVEVVNDINGDIVALYRCIQNHCDELFRTIDGMICSRQEIKDLQTHRGLTDIQRAARFYYLNRVSFAGNGTSLGVTRGEGGGCHFTKERNRALISALQVRLDGVTIEHVSYEHCLELYDTDQSFFFLDPPYLAADVKIYAGWNEAQLTQFRDRVMKLKGRWLVTLDDSELNRRLFEGCRIQAIATHNGCVHQGKISRTFGELLIEKP